IKYLGSPYEYNSGKHKRTLAEQPLNIVTAVYEIAKAKLFEFKQQFNPLNPTTKPNIKVVRNLNLLDEVIIDFDNPEQLKEVVGNNLAYDVSINENNEIVTNWKNVLDLKYLLDKSPIGLPIVGIGMGHFMGNNHIAKEIVIPGLNIQAPYQSLMKGYSTEPGAVWLFVPVNKPTEIKDGQGNSYKPVKLLTKAFENEEWGDRAPNSLLSRLARLFNKVLKGEIKISQQGVNDFSFVDESVERFKSLKNEGNKG